jgi:hypothetical protein
MTGKMDVRSTLRYSEPVTAPSKQNGPVKPVYESPHQTDLANWSPRPHECVIFWSAVHAIMAIHCTFSKFQYNLKIILRCSNDNRSSAIFFALTFDKVALALM